MDKRYYKEYYKLERKHWWFRVREQIILQAMKKQLAVISGLNILNVGCATGRSHEYLSQFGEVTSVEYDADCCNFLIEELKIPVIHASVTDLPFENDRFDCVCAFDIIEHVEDHQQAVNELCRVARTGGSVFVTVPAFMELWSKHDVINHHFRRYRLPELNSLFLFRTDGLVVYKTYFNSILFPLIWIFRKISAMVFADKKHEELKSDFNDPDENRISDSFLGFVFTLEKWLLRVITFPFGVSAMIIWKKNKRT